MNKLYIKHKLTAYHYRKDKKEPYSLAICSCGWNCSSFRRRKRQTKLRGLRKLCWLRGHKWGEWDAVEAGPLDFEDGEGIIVGWYRQCDRCWNCENRENDQAEKTSI